MRFPSEYQPYVDKALEAGWELSLSGTGHPKLSPPPGATDQHGEPARAFCFPGSPKAKRGRGLLNVRARFRQSGIDC